MSNVATSAKMVSSPQNITKHDVEAFLQANEIFTRDFVTKYLKSNPKFVDEYFLSYASMELFEEWYDKQVNLKLNRSRNKISKTPFNTSINEDGVYKIDTPAEGGTTERCLPYKDTGFHSRRKSEPIKKDGKKRNGGESSDKITELNSIRSLRKSHTLPKTKYRTISIDDNNNSNEYDEDPTTMSMKFNLDINSKPFLRKAQSAPTYKADLSQLIRSSVYSGSPTNKHINVENRMILKESDEQNFLVEIIKDVSKDLSLHRTCFRIVVNFGFMLNIEKASIYIMYKDNDSSVLRLELQHVTIEDGVRRGSLSRKFESSTDVPFGKGIIGYVASTGESLLCNDVKKNKLFDAVHDNWYDNSVRNALVHSVADDNGETIAVIVAINSKGGDFSEEDKQIGATFLSFCGSSITNAKIFELTKEEFDRNRVSSLIFWCYV